MLKTYCAGKLCEMLEYINTRNYYQIAVKFNKLLNKIF